MILGCFSCEKPNNLEQKAEALMKIHDEEMAKMDMIFSLKKQLKLAKDSATSESLIQLYDKRIKSLEQADEAMMEWMRNYKVPDIKEEERVKLEYYDQEYQKMIQVKNLMNQSIDSANIVIKQNQMP